MAMLWYTLRGRVCQILPYWKVDVKPRLILLILTDQGVTLTSELAEQSEFSKVVWCWQDVPTLQSLNTSSKSAINFILSETREPGGSRDMILNGKQQSVRALQWSVRFLRSRTARECSQVGAAEIGLDGGEGSWFSLYSLLARGATEVLAAALPKPGGMGLAQWNPGAWWELL